MQLHITEHKSSGALRPKHFGCTVRVFIDGDYHYGYFVDEHLVFSLLSAEQQAEYLATDSDIKFDISAEEAVIIIKDGISPFKDKS